MPMSKFVNFWEMSVTVSELIMAVNLILLWQKFHFYFTSIWINPHL